MPFKPPRKKPQFAQLKSTLAQADPDNRLYQTVQAIIEKLIQFDSVDEEQKAALGSDITKIGGAITGGGGSSTGSGLANITYLTKDNELATVSNSIQLLAGYGIKFDDSIPHKRIISTNHYDAPLTDGDLIAADLIFAAGECIIVQVPV